MDVSVVCKESLLSSMVEVGSMVDAGNLAWGSSKNLWLPCVKMGIEVDDRDRTVSTVDGPEQRESDSVISTEGDDSGECLSVLSRSLLLRVSSGSTGENGVVSLFDLVEGPSVVVSATQISLVATAIRCEAVLRCHRNVSTVKDSGP
jgi:hypothetical protein